MKRGRGFIYSTSTASNNSTQRTRGPGQAGKNREGTTHIQKGGTLSCGSPRKRQRSPEPNITSSTRQTRGGYDGRQGRSEDVVISVAKLAKRNEEYDPSFEEDDDIDALGTAALEEFELTQRPTSSPPPPPAVTNITSTSFAPHTYNPKPAPKMGPFNTRERASNVYGSSATVSSQVTTTTFQSDEYKEKIQQLQEQNYTKDGEVKVLRNEKERLLGELRKKDQLVHDLQTELLLEKQSKEEEFSKEKQALTSRLHFKDQEMIALRERCSLLEQTHKNLSSNTQTPSPLPKQTQPSTSSATPSTRVPRLYHQTPTTAKNSRTEFLSTETFMPISQVSHVTPVRLGQKRTAQEGRHEEAAGGTISTKESKSDQRKSKSPSISPSTSTVSSFKKIDSEKKLSRVRSSNSETQSVPVPAQTSANHIECECAPVIIDVPKKQLDGAQLLMLLIKHDLGKAPLYVARSVSSTGDSSSENSENSQSTVDSVSSVSRSEGKRLTGLLSLLHLEEKTPIFLSSTFPNVLKTPVHATTKLCESYSRQPSLESYKPIPALNPGLSNSPGPSTPIRKSRLHLKPHTCARTDVARGRMRTTAVSAITPQRFLSEANTPVLYRGVSESVSASLVSSLDKRELEQSIAGLLHFTDYSKMSTSLSKSCDNSGLGKLLSISLTSARSLQDPVLRLLNQIGDLVIRYHSEQSSKVKALANMSSSHFTADVSDIADVSSVATPKSSLSSSTTSSKSSSDLISPQEGDQKFVNQALDILETLVLYSEKVREQILIRPPEFVMESRPSSSLGVHQVTPNVTVNNTSVNMNSEDENLLNDSVSVAGKKLRLSKRRVGGSPTVSKLVQVAHRLTSLEAVEVTPSCVSSPKKVKEWKKEKLVGYKSFHKVWSTQQSSDSPSLHNGQSDPNKPFTPATHTPATGHRCGQLFSILLDLPVPSWRESIENTTACLRILTVLADHCPVENLTWFSSLLQEDKLGVCLDKEDSRLALVVLKLLTSLVRSPDVASELCGHGDPCIPITCYQCLVDPPTAAEGNLNTVFNIRSQILRFISNILVLSNGPKVLFETCSCSYELLKLVVTFLNGLVEDVNHVSQWTHHECLLLRESLLLLHKINIHDRYFDTHRESCEHGLTFVLNTLSWLLKTSDFPLEDEVMMVNELLECCEEVEDSQEDSSEENPSIPNKEEKMDTN